jgi:hypothetical protein
MGYRELAVRVDGGISVRLLWDAERDQVVLQYSDRRSAETLVVDVPNGEAMAAFHHPNLFRPRLAA